MLKKETVPYILLDSGDLAQGTPEGILTKGMASVVLMNQLGYAAVTPGNHDFDYGEANLKVLVSSSSFPFLGANLYRKDTGVGPAYLKPYTIVQRGGRRIAVLGIVGKHTATSTLPINVKHLHFRDEAAETARWLPALRKHAPDAVIVLAHWGLDEALGLKRIDVSTWTFNPPPPGTLGVARAAEGIDLVLGGHNHAALLKGYHDPVSGAWLGESGYGLSYVTRAELTFDDATGKLTGTKVAVLPLWVDQTGEDPRVLETIAGFNAAVEKAMGRVVGRAATDLGFAPDGLDSALGSWFCDITRKATGADMAFHNTKGLRDEIKKGILEAAVQYDTILKNLSTAEQAAKDAREAMDSMAALYSEGRKSIADLQLMREMFLNAQASYQEISTQTELQRAKLLFLSGQLDDMEIHKIAKKLTP